jgi:hypothetical protein
MRALWNEANKGETLDFEKATAACAIAKDAAPYLHARLSNIEARVAVTGHEAALAELEEVAIEAAGLIPTILPN